MRSLYLALGLLAAVPARADEQLLLRPAADIAIGATALGTLVATELLQDRLVPASCRICEGPDNSGLPGTGGRGSLNAVDAWFHDALTVSWREGASTASTVLADAIVPLGAIAGAFAFTGPSASDGAGLRAALIVAESAAVSSALVQLTKFATARKRPFVRYGHGAPEGAYAVAGADDRLSLPSGHTALTASVTTSLAMAAQLQGSSAAPWLWGAAAAMTGTVGALRIAAEKHYFTDVLAGAAIGAGCGIAIPLLHRPGALLGRELTFASAPLAFSVSGRM